MKEVHHKRPHIVGSIYTHVNIQKTHTETQTDERLPGAEGEEGGGDTGNDYLLVYLITKLISDKNQETNGFF